MLKKSLNITVDCVLVPIKFSSKKPKALELPIAAKPLEASGEAASILYNNNYQNIMNLEIFFKASPPLHAPERFKVFVSPYVHIDSVQHTVRALGFRHCHSVSHYSSVKLANKQT